MACLDQNSSPEWLFMKFSKHNFYKLDQISCYVTGFLLIFDIFLIKISDVSQSNVSYVVALVKVDKRPWCMRDDEDNDHAGQ